MDRKTILHSIGHVIRNVLTKEEACILRVINPRSMAAQYADGGNVIAYVVSVPPSRLATARESVWLHADVAPVP